MVAQQRAGILVYLVGALVLAAAAIGGYALWHSKQLAIAQARASRAAEVERGPPVEVMAVERGPNVRTVALLGDVQPFATATLYAKISGYLKRVDVDKGDKVAAGQLIAEIESPETDHQYQSAVADYENKKNNAARMRGLLPRDFVSHQAAEQADTDEHMAAALVAQLGALKSYEILRAPFAGVVTARFADPGALVQNATTNQSSNLPVVTIVDSSRLRVYAYLEQQDVPFVHVGDTAVIADTANPTRRVSAAVTRTAGQLDSATRTLLLEYDIDNAQNFLLPGSFVNVTLAVPTPSYPRVPAGALITRGSDAFVATVDADDRVHFRPVRVAATDGANVNLAEGAAVGEKVAVDLPPGVVDGSRIQPVAKATAK
jgi:membrane fusion protein, multidrug efflux system